MPSSAVEVRFTPVIGIAFIAIGAVNLVLGLWLLLLGSFNLSFLLGIVLLAAGVVHLRRTYFRLEQGLKGGRATLSGPGRFGPLANGVMANAGERFAVEEGRLVHVAGDGSRTPAPVRRWMAHPKDWRSLESVLVVPPHQPSDAPEEGVS